MLKEWIRQHQVSILVKQTEYLQNLVVTREQKAAGSKRQLLLANAVKAATKPCESTRRSIFGNDEPRLNLSLCWMLNAFSSGSNDSASSSLDTSEVSVYLRHNLATDAIACCESLQDLQAGKEGDFWLSA